MSMKCVQINLQHSKCASDNLLVLLAEDNIDIAIIQEPWVRDETIKGLANKHYNLFYRQGNGKPRTCILIKKHINAFLCSNYSTADLTVVKLENSCKDSIYISSVYMAHDRPAPPEELTTLTTYITSTKVDLLVGCDANARHVLWGSSENNERGEYLFDFIINSNFLVCNRGNSPTFTFPSSDGFDGWEEVLDVTLITDNSRYRVNLWRVSNLRSYSDHKWILFELSFKIDTPQPYRNPRRTDWNRFRQVARRKLSKLPNPEIQSTEDLDANLHTLEKAMSTAYKVSCPVKYSKKTFPPWWNENLSTLRRTTRVLFNICYERKYWQPYKDCLNTYKKAIRDAKKQSWMDYCQSIESTKDSARLSKILSKGHSNPSFLRAPDGTWTASSAECLELLINTHFPGCVDTNDNSEAGISHEPLISREEISSILTNQKVQWAVNSFAPYKSPGLDGIMPIMLQKLPDLVTPWLVAIFRGCIALNYVPQSWRRVKVVFIPKTAKQGHESAKDFRPISLTSFVLKTLERVVDTHIRQTLERAPLSKSQHAYCKGRSVETALHEVLRPIEHSIHFKQYALAAFLDIEGAFNNISTESIQTALAELGVEAGISRWIVSMLSTRIIESELGNSHVKKMTQRGTPQGGVLSPLLWTMVMNKVLLRLEGLGVRVVAYADDVAILVLGRFLSVISEIMEGALRTLSSWSRDCGLGVNAGKTELMLFTTKTKVPDFILPRLDGQTLQLSPSARYLGVILDTKLNWRLNVEYRAKRACMAFYACRRTFGRRWGLQPKMVLWMYTAVVRPIMTHGALVWWPALTKGYNQTKLGRIQRTAGIGVTGALRSTPTQALSVLLHLLPIDLHIKSQALQTALRLRESGCWKARPYGHGRTLELLPREWATGKTDYTVPKLDFSKGFEVKIPTRKEWDMLKTPHEGYDAVVYTDGSKMDCGVGAGIFSETLNISKSYRLPDHSSVFQAELLAILQACKELGSVSNPNQNIAIFTDSQAAIKALDSAATTSKLVGRCRDELARLVGRHKVTLHWVPGHRNIEGNELADELARRGSALHASLAEDVPIPISAVKRGISLHFLSEANSRWKNLTTCAVSRQVWPCYNKNKTRELLSRTRRDIARVTAITTGHWPIGEHAARLGIPFNTFCRSCREVGAKETLTHFLCECPALARTRYRFLGSPFLGDLKDISKVNIHDIIQFLNATVWL